MGCGNLIFAHDNPFNRETLDGKGLYFKDAAELTSLFNRAEDAGCDMEGLRTGAKLRAHTFYQWPDIVNCYAKLLNETKAPIA